MTAGASKEARAAAKEIKVALELALKILGTHSNFAANMSREEFNRHLDAWDKQARAALAKAKGEAA